MRPAPQPAWNNEAAIHFLAQEIGRDRALRGARLPMEGLVRSEKGEQVLALRALVAVLEGNGHVRRVVCSRALPKIKVSRGGSMIISTRMRRSRTMCSSSLYATLKMPEKLRNIRLGPQHLVIALGIGLEDILHIRLDPAMALQLDAA